jgi:hydrogenase nickel incorporation protein HypA/HybF
MHELSIAQSIVEIVEQYVPPENQHSVRNIRLRVGELAGVVPESLEFCYSAIVAESSLQHSKLVIDWFPYTVRCSFCEAISRSTMGIVQCPNCESYQTVVMSGTELNVAEIELAESMETV